MIYHFVDGEGRMSVVKITDPNFFYTDVRSLVQGVLPPHLPVIEVHDQYPDQLTREEVVEEVMKWRDVNKGVATAGLRAMLKKVSGLLRGETRRR